METTFYAKWEKFFKDIELPVREPVWQKAIEFLRDNKIITPTMANELSQDWIQEIMMEKCVDPIFTTRLEVIQYMSKWIIGIKIDSFPDWVETGKELWLLYLMDFLWDRIWNGMEWIEREKEVPEST